LSGSLLLFSRLLLLALALVLQGCATQLIAVGDWGRTPDLHLASDTLQDVRIKVTCHRIDPQNNQLQWRRYGLCATLAGELVNLGAEIVDPEGEETAPFTLQYVDVDQSDESGSAISYIAGALTGWLVPYVSTSTSRAEFRILDARGVQIDVAPMTITQVRVFGWGALAGLRGNSLADQQTKISRQFFMLAKNRMASHVRATKWAQP
jgi:hypothetical protein